MRVILKLVALLATIVALFATGWILGVRYEEGQTAIRDLQIANEQKAAYAKFRNTERGWMDDVAKAQQERAIREKTLKADADRARNERDGLRDELANANRQLATAPIDAVRKYASAVNDVFEQCSREYQEVARLADGHLADRLTLEKAWPKRN